MNSFVLKIIAVIAMTLDHIGAAFFPLGSGFQPYDILLRTVGRLTMPIMCFFIGEGYRKTRDRKKYAIRLFVFALISEIPYRLFFEEEINVMFTLFIGFCGLWASDVLKDTMKSDSFRVPVYLLSVIAALLIDSDWGYIGVLLIYAFYHGRESRAKAVLYPLSVYAFVLLTAYIEALFVNGFGTFYINYIQFAGCLSIPLLMAYNGNKGPSLKYLFYVYYPLHLVILWAVNAFLI